MGEAKKIIVKPISSRDANKLTKALHYSGKVVANSQLHFGAFIGNRCGGVMQFGASLDKRKMLCLVKETKWNDFLEPNRMAFADWLPRNGESRCIAFALKFIKKHYPNIEWIVSFADGTQCGDGTIYRASGFCLTSIKKNTTIWETLEGGVFTDLGVRTGKKENKKIVGSFNSTTMPKGANINHTGAASMKRFKEAGCKPKAGFQLRYIYFLNPAARDRLNVPIIPFSEIERRGAAMYKGEKITRDKQDSSSFPDDSGGAAPTVTLQKK